MNASQLRRGVPLPLALVLIAYLLLSLAYGVINPLFEAPDEYWHYFNAQFIADTGRLPEVNEEYDPWLGQEAAQPPLYYLLGAIVISPVNTAGARQSVWLNPFAWIGDATAVANVNRVVHTPLESWPWHGYVLAAHLLRVMSTMFGLGTLLCIYGCGRLLWPSNERFALLATALVAFLPQFNFIHGAISNDSLITFLSSIAIWQLLRLWLTSINRRRLLFLGITVGLAALTKNAGILLLAYATGVMVLLAWREGRTHLLSETAAFLFLPAVGIAGWLWWRNWQLYGDFTAANQFIRIAGGDRGYSLGQILSEMRGLWVSFFGIFGWFNVRPPEWVFLSWNAGVLLSAVGSIRKTSNDGLRSAGSTSGKAILNKAWFPSALMAAWFLLVVGGLVIFLMRTEAAQGRLLFPALAPLFLALAYGLCRLPWRAICLIAPATAFISSVYCLFFVIAPTYAQPTIINQLPQQAVPLDMEMGQGLRLIGARVDTDVAQPGEITKYTLYWTADSVPREAPESVFELFGRELTRIGHLHGYHGRGLYPASLWPKGKIVAERIAVRLEAEIEAPVLARVQNRLVGEQSVAAIGSVKIVPTEWPSDPGVTIAKLGDSIEIASVALAPTLARPGELITVTMTWRALAAPGRELTTLLHLGEFGLPPMTTGDGPPIIGDYPTSAWEAGEIIEDVYHLRLPLSLSDTRQQVWIGMYDSANPNVRLPMTVGGERQAGDVLLVGWVEVEE